MQPENDEQPRKSPPLPNLAVSELAEAHPDLVKRLAATNRFDSLGLFAGLLTFPELQPFCIRLEALVHLATAYADGPDTMTHDLAESAFVELGNGVCGRLEDPPEDVFSATVLSSKGNHRIIQGIWESAAFHLQRTINVVEQLFSRGSWGEIADSVFGLLALSDAVCERAGLERFSFKEPADSFSPSCFAAARERVTFSLDDLSKLGVGLDALEPFIFDPRLKSVVPSTSLLHSPLLDHPLLRSDDSITVALPAALSVAVRRFVFGGLIRLGRREDAATLLKHEFRTLFQKRPLLGVGQVPPIHFREDGEVSVAEYAAEVEPGRIAHFMFILDSLAGFDRDGLAGSASYTDSLGTLLPARVSAIRDSVRQAEPLKEGVTFVVFCGIGRGSVGFIPETASVAFDKWSTVLLSAADAELLTLLDATVQTVLRTLRVERRLADVGVSLVNFTGFLNLLAWVRSLGGHLVDHASFPEEPGGRPIHLFLPTNMILDLRLEHATKVDRHRAPLPDGSAVTICRESGSMFEEDAARPIYVDEQWNDGYGFRLAYQGERLDLWCEVYSTGGYDRWKMLHTWLPRLGEVLDRDVAGPRRPPMLFRVHFDGAAGEVAPAAIPGADDILAESAITIDRDGRRVTLRFGQTFEQGLAQPENVSESMLVRQMVVGALDLLVDQPEPALIDAIHSAIVPNTDVRDSHVFRAIGFRDFVHESIPSMAIGVDAIDETTDRLGLGWLPGEPIKGAVVEGKKECLAFLRNVVRRVEDDLCSDLRPYDRRSLIMLALLNHESAMVTQHRWRTTARAGLALRTDRADGLLAILRNEAQNNATLLASRVLVELAVCECPSLGGIMPGDLDLARLMSKLLTAIQFGGWSDAIYFDAMVPSLEITPLGDIRGDVRFITDVAQPFGRLAGESIVRSEVDRYEKHFREPSVTERVEGLLDERFTSAWYAEKQYTIDDFRVFVDEIEDIGIARKQAVFGIRLGELRVHLESHLAGWEHLIRSLTVGHRPTWREPPNDMSERELRPWRFRRQLSLVRRPFVQIDLDPDPEFIVAPGLLRDALGHTVRGYHEGAFSHDQLASPSMRTWFGNAAKERGRAFTEKVGALARECGWQADIDVPVRRILTGRASAPLGDIDVLCRDVESRRVLLVECKDLHFHKSLSELAEQVQDFRGETRGTKRDDMRKHIDRTDAIRADLAVR